MLKSKSIIPFAASEPAKSYENCMTGSFSYRGKPVSILMNDGKVVQSAACHAWLGYPEAVLYQFADGKVDMMEAMSTDELPKGVIMAVGGCGLGKFYNPKKQGFCRIKTASGSYDYSDVLRRTNHNVLAYKDGTFYGLLYENMTGDEISRAVGKYEFALLLDGGHLASINSEKYSFNASQKQSYLIQFPKEEPVVKEESSGKLYKVQVGVFRVKRNAQALKKDLEIRGYRPFIVES